MIFREIEDFESRSAWARAAESARDGARVVGRESGRKEVGLESPVPSTPLRSQGHAPGPGGEGRPHVTMPYLTVWTRLWRISRPSSESRRARGGWPPSRSLGVSSQASG